MEIVGQAPTGKTALLRNQMVASLGDHLAFVVLRLTVVTHHTAMAGRSEQESSEVTQNIPKWKQVIDDCVVVRNEMENASPGWIGTPWQRQQQDIGSLPPGTHGLKRRQEQIASWKARIEGRDVEVVLRT